MSNLTNRAKGKIEEIAGTLQKKVGHALGDQEMEQKGADRELKGEAKQAVAKAGEQIKGAAERVVGSVKASVGEAVGNDRLSVKGKVQSTKGKIRQDLNK